MVDKLIGKITKDMVKKGEQEAPVKSVKIKVKFQKAKERSIDKHKK